VEGLAKPGNYYSSFIERYLDYPSWLRATLLWGSKLFVGIVGYNSVITDAYHLRIVGGGSVQLIYACLGVGVMSFWLAFVVANKGNWKKKMIWVIGGFLCIWIINVLRIGLVLIQNNTRKEMMFGLDNHTFFNILSYVAIFGLILLYDKSFKKAWPSAT
jgi:exosortase/archaeosortase family protein